MGVGVCWIHFSWQKGFHRNRLPRFGQGKASGSSAKFRADDGCGHGHIQAFTRCPASRIIGNEEALADARSDFGRDALALIAHDDDAMRGQLFGVDVLAIEEGAVDRDFVAAFAEETGQGEIVDPDPPNGSHRGLHDLGA